MRMVTRVVLFLMLVAVGFGAVTREEIVIEQSDFGSQSTAQTGVWVWTPLGDDADKWVLNVLSTHYARIEPVETSAP